MSVEYKFLITKNNENLGYQSKKGIKINNPKGLIKIYINNIWIFSNKNFENFFHNLTYTLLIERICLEIAFNKIRIKGGRCNKDKLGICIPQYIAFEIFKFLNY